MFRAREKKQDQSIGGVILKYKLLIALAIAGVAIATWQLLRR